MDKQDTIGGGEVAKEKIFWTLVGDELISKITISIYLSKNNDFLFSQYALIVLY